MAGNGIRHAVLIIITCTRSAFFPDFLNFLLESASFSSSTFMPSYFFCVCGVCIGVQFSCVCGVCISARRGCPQPGGASHCVLPEAA